jgi:hypothetical protein
MMAQKMKRLILLPMLGKNISAFSSSNANRGIVGGSYNMKNLKIKM